MKVDSYGHIVNYIFELYPMANRKVIYFFV